MIFSSFAVPLARGMIDYYENSAMLSQSKHWRMAAHPSTGSVWQPWHGAAIFMLGGEYCQLKRDSGGGQNPEEEISANLDSSLRWNDNE